MPEPINSETEDFIRTQEFSQLQPKEKNAYLTKLSRRASLTLGVGGVGLLVMANQESAQAVPYKGRTAEQINEALDKFEVEKLYHRLRQARDMSDWPELVSCYQPDAIIDISWFKGTAAEFAKASVGMAEKLQSFHEVFPGVVKLNGNRAISQTMVVIHLISELDGCEVDCVGYCYGRYRIERRTDEWLVAAGTSIYIYDTLIPTDPNRVPKLDQTKLASYRPSYRYISYMLEKRGLPHRNDRAGMDKPETVKALIAADLDWLNGGEGKIAGA